CCGRSRLTPPCRRRSRRRCPTRSTNGSARPSRGTRKPTSSTGSSPAPTGRGRTATEGKFGVRRHVSALGCFLFGSPPAALRNHPSLGPPWAIRDDLDPAVHDERVVVGHRGGGLEVGAGGRAGGGHRLGQGDRLVARLEGGVPGHHPQGADGRAGGVLL